MEYLVTAQEMKAYDKATIEEIGIPALVLMERAALAVLEEIEVLSCDKASVLILAGYGNNGGDGLALARMLSERGYGTDVLLCGNPRKATEEWKAQEAILKHYPVKTDAYHGGKDNNFLLKEYNIFVDALFGVGLSRPVTGDFAELIQWMNASKGIKIAVDIPSGVDADNGQVLGCAVKADLTVCLGLAKRGLYFYPGNCYSGRVVIKEIGIGEAAFRGKPGMAPGMYCYDGKISDLLPARRPDGNKGTFGKVLFAAGSHNMAGAAVFAARACYRSGAGMVKVVTPECNRQILQAMVPEALLYTGKESLREALQRLEAGGLQEASRRAEMEHLWKAGHLAKEENSEGISSRSDVRHGSKAWWKLPESAMDWPDILAIGPGLGTGEEALALLRQFLLESRKPLLIDADGLNLLALHQELQQELSSQAGNGRKVVLTPHVGELSRLIGESVADIKAHPAEAAMALADRLHCIVVSKDARTLTCQSGSPVCMNRSGNSGMATAGSGDVLAGIIAGLLAQGMEPFAAASAGAYWHGLAGDAASAALGERAVTASDLITYLKER